jgi:2-methylcitrate dehydratase PrpD
MSHPIEVFADYAVRFRHTELPEEVIHHAKRAVMDWHAAMLPGWNAEPVKILRKALGDDLGHGPSLLPDGRRATARSAALILGTAAHAAELDDSFRDAMYHPGAATIAAALATAQQVGASGLELLRAVVLGYEISTRIGVALGRAHYQYWHNTGTVGSFGAAAAAGYLLELPGPAHGHALATAATFAAGLQQAFRSASMSKPLHAGRAAEAGVLAASMAAGGLTGACDVLDGEAGMGRAMGAEADWSEVGRTLGDDFHITRITFKNHVGCGHTFAAIDAALALREAHAIKADDIAAVQVHTYGPALAIARQVDPRTASEACFSMPYVLASALMHGSVRLAAYEAGRLHDPRLRGLMGRISAQVDPALDAAFPAQRAARVDIALRNGQRLSLMQPHRKGDPELPLSDEELQGKFEELASAMLDGPAVGALRQAIWALDTAKDLTGLHPTHWKQGHDKRDSR